MLDDRQLADALTEASVRAGCAGAAAAVCDSRTLTEAGVGRADVRGIRVSPRTPFQIGSTTKLHTAAAALSLVGEGRLELDTPIVQIVPELDLGNAAATAALTTRHCLSMSSGLDNGPYPVHGPPDVGDYVKGLRDIAMQFPPGTGFGYSNASTCVTGLVTERLVGEPWFHAVRTLLLQPAGLEETGTILNPPSCGPVAEGLDVGAETGAITRPPFSAALAPAGSTLVATAADLARLGQVFLSAAEPQTGRVLSAEAVNMAHTPQVAVPPTGIAEHWGLGPLLTTWSATAVAGHSGTNVAGSSYLVSFPAHGVSLATVTNTPSAGYALARNLWEILATDLVEAQPPGPLEVGDAWEDPARLVGRYAMCGTTMEVRTSADGLILRTVPDDGEPSEGTLLPSRNGCYLPTDPAVTGGRGWGIAFLGPADAAATHLVNGVFALRRIGSS